MQFQNEQALLEELQKTYIGLAKIESWLLADPSNIYNGARNYRYTDTSGVSYPVFIDRATAGDPVAAIAGQIDKNVSWIGRQNLQSGRNAFIVRKKVT